MHFYNSLESYLYNYVNFYNSIGKLFIYYAKPSDFYLCGYMHFYNYIGKLFI